MADQLADLVLPDKTPVKSLSDEDLPRTKKAKPPAAKSRDTSASRFRAPRAGDVLIVVCGVGLAALCAVFPWYIFYNQEQFGVRPLTFSGAQGDNGKAPSQLSSEYAELLASRPQLDPIPTGTVPDEPPYQESIPEQPFPGNRVDFRLLHVANGRAMIEDEDGFWLVQRGSHLPDGSRVAQILQRDGTWMLVTSEEKEIALSR